FVGDVAEVLVYNRGLGENDRDAVASYLNERYAFIGSAPATPASLTTQAVSPTEVNLGWTSSLGTSSTRFFIERKTGVGGTYAQIATVRDATAYLDTSCAPNTQYYYRVRARKTLAP